MPSESSPQDVVVHRLSQSARKASSRVRFPWRTRKRAARPALTAEQKKALKDACDKKKQNLRDTLIEARDLIWDAAGKLEKNFGGHDTNYYFRLILQTALRIKKAPRKITLWNVFVSKELKKLNKEPSAIGGPK
ncbi:hypothetical protein C8Q80DRAFT_1123748 [Daedaleopsis nitida]|nr:hypothetical protein C8Q80DRAFT_1123748 [Daedaleopsis nitida]